MSFDWQTDEDNEWDDKSWQEKPVTAVQPKPPWRTILIIVVLISVVGIVIYQQVNKRLDDATSSVESDIFATHNLLSRAAADQDADLGKAVLSGRDMGWSQVQSDLITAGLFYENPIFGLSLADAEMAYEPLFREDERFIDLQLDPDLNGAELSYARDFLAFTEDGLETVTLQQTAVYRRGETRWLFSPPLEGFWGEWQTVEQDNVTYVYPERDGEVMVQLADDLSTLLAEACATLPEMDCSPTIRIRFDTDSESLLEATDPANLYEGNLRLNLPTPTLVGLPINNDGYEALLYAYGSKIISALIGHTLAYECCNRAPMFQALMTFQLSEMGLAHWPVTAQTQRDLANTGVHTELLFPYWSSTDFSSMNDEGSWQLFGFIDFLLKQYVPRATAMELMAQIIDARVYQSWLVSLTDELEYNSFDQVNVISRDWWFYALTQAEAAAVSRQPISLPAQDLQVGCMDNPPWEEMPQTLIYRYKLGSDTWEQEYDYAGLAFFNPLPQDDGVVLQLVDVSEEQYWQTLLWQNGRSVELMNMNDVYSISLGQMDPNGRFLLSYFGTEEFESAPSPQLIDMASCLAGTCDSTSLSQTPHWSPNGQRMLLSDMNLFESAQYMVDGRVITLNPDGNNQVSALWLRDAQAAPAEAVAVGEGGSPFWINNEQFGYIRNVPDATSPVSQELVVASVNDLESETVVTTAVLTEALPEGIGSNPLNMKYAIAHPTDESLLVLMATSRSYDSYLFQINRQTREITPLFPVDLSRGEHSLGFSPDGRFLAATGTIQQDSTSLVGENNIFGALHLYDLESGELQTILVNTDIFFPSFTFDWSMDGNWLAFTRDSNVIGLLAPAYDYQQMIVHEEGNCTSLAWINPLSTD
ncbi:MAG: hypothetical protein CL608_09665 [Anaerolineaceae bacterium]|nr:hypothetical protein [Anaerolineaceae bacterium]